MLTDRTVKASRLSHRAIQDENPEIPRYSVISHEVWSVVEFVNGKSRNMGDGANARLAFEMADRLAKANGGMASIMGGAGFKAESNYSGHGRQGTWDPSAELEARLSGRVEKTFVSLDDSETEVEKESLAPGQDL